MISWNEGLEVPMQMSGSGALALGVDRGMHLLLEPHRKFPPSCVLVCAPGRLLCTV